MKGLTEIFKASALNKYYAGVKGETLAETMFPMAYNKCNKRDRKRCS